MACPVACEDCRCCTSEFDEWYMLEDDVCAEACPDDPEVILCIGCVEHRLGRELELADFAKDPANLGDPDGRSERLNDRPSRHPAEAVDYPCPNCCERDGGCGGRDY
jgi:hypothetical protein